MPKRYKQPFPVEKWRKIRELLYLFSLFFYTILLLHDAATAFLTYDVYSWAGTIAKLEQVVIPALLLVLYLSNIIFDRSYFIFKSKANGTYKSGFTQLLGFETWQYKFII